MADFKYPEIEGTKEEKEKIKQVIDRAINSDTAREVLEKAVASGYSFNLTPPGGSSVCLPKKKKICLSPKLSDDEMVFGLIHESRHAGQYENGFYEYNSIYNNTVKTQLISSRIMEADAQAITCHCANELSEKGDKNVLLAFDKSFGYISKPYKEAKSGKVMAAFEGWYDNDEIKLAYENTNHVVHLTFSDPRNFEFSQEIPTKEMISKACVLEGKSYFEGEPEKLEKGKFADMSKRTKSLLNDYMADRRIPNGLPADYSYKNLPDREEKVVEEKPLSIEERKAKMRERLEALKKQKEQKTQLEQAVKSSIIKDR